VYLKKAELFHAYKREEGKAAYAISRTTQKAAYFDIREDEKVFSFHTHFLLK